MKHTGPKVVRFDRYIFNQMLRRRKDKSVTSVEDVVGAQQSTTSELSHTGA